MTFNERTFFAGVVTLALAGVALLARGPRRAQLPFLVLGVLALAIPLHAPGLYQLVEHLPGFSLVQNQRMHFVFECSAAVLAAFGLDALLSGRAGRRALLAPATLLLAAAVAALVLRPGREDVRQVAEHFLTGADVATDAALSLTSVTWAAVLAGAVGAALLAMRRWPRRIALLAGALVLLAAFDMLRFADGYQPMGDPAKVIPPKTPAVRYLERHAGEGRVVGLRFAFPNDWTLVYGLRDVRGYDPPYPSLRLYRLWLHANPGQGNWESFKIGAIEGPAHQVMNVLGARWVVADPGARLDPLLSPGVRPVYRGEDATIFENTRAAPRAFVPRTVEVAEAEAVANATLTEDGFDVRRTAVVEQGERGAAALAGAPPVRGRAVVTGERNARVELRATLDRRGLVVLDDALFEGWRVEVDGRPAPVVRVDSVLRGVVVPAGSHQIVWSYTVPGIRLGAALSLVTALALLAAAVALRLRRRTARPRDRARSAVAV